MAYWIELPTFQDSRGGLTVVDKILPYEIKRVYYIYDVTEKRGGHRHHKAIQFLVCLAGSCEVYINDGDSEKIYKLDSNTKGLLVEPKDWHTMDAFSKGSVLLVFSSEHYSKGDYIDEPYHNL